MIYKITKVYKSLLEVLCMEFPAFVSSGKSKTHFKILYHYFKMCLDAILDTNCALIYL